MIQLNWKCPALLVLLLLIFSVSLSAQDDEATPASESFTVLPRSIKAGSENIILRFSASKEDLFRTSSVKQPKVLVGAGLTLVDGSFRVLNSSEAEIRVNVDNEVIGGIEVSLTFYSQDGSTAIRQEKATVGVVGPVKIGETNNETEVSVSQVMLVVVNTDSQQAIGDLVMKGKLNGPFTVKPPAGSLFFENATPGLSLDTGSATFANPRVSIARDQFDFSITNPTRAEITIRVSDMVIDTSSFTALGGSVGTLQASVESVTLGEEAILFAPAYTALDSLSGDDVPQDDDTTSDETTDDTSDTTSNTGSTGTTGSTNFRSNSSSGSSAGRTSSSGRNSSRERTNSRNWNNNRNNGNGSRNNRSNAPGTNRNRFNRNRWSGKRTMRTPSRPRSPSSGSKGGSGNPIGPAIKAAEGTLYAELKSELDNDVSEGLGDEVDLRIVSAREMKLSNSLYFADSNGKRLAGVVLENALASEKNTRVWVVLERAEDISDKIDRVQVKLRIGGEIRMVELTETNATSRIFKSAKDGVKVVAQTHGN